MFQTKSNSQSNKVASYYNPVSNYSVNDLPVQAFSGDVVIGVNRFGFGSDSTCSKFVANVYDAHGNLVESLSGYMIEPRWDPNMSTVPGSDTAIPNGQYTVGPCYHHGASGFYEIQGVPGRSAIHIHSGNYGSDTEGCLLPASSYKVLSDDNYMGTDSGNMLKALNSLIDKYYRPGNDTINIGN